jgi:glycerophosphoryl diester phosphodiesterase
MYPFTQLFTAMMMVIAITGSLITAVHAQDDKVMKDNKVIIAHRGASGYVPEHTLAAKTLAHEMGADFIEQDVVLSRDRIPVVLHDIYLDAVTNVASAFPDRARADGKFYVIDFDVAELKSLHMHERINPETGKVKYAGRPARMPEHMHIATLAEEIAVIQGLNKSSGRNVGLYVEVKSPAWHQQQGEDISPLVLAILAKYGYTRRTDNIFIQSFDPAELQRIRSELGSDLKLVQLIGENDWNEADTDYDVMRTAPGIGRIATYADGIGPAIDHVINVDESGTIRISKLVAEAHKHGLQVHPYTVRQDALPGYVSSFDELLEWLFVRADVDGVFTDFPDLAVQYRDRDTK